MAHGSHGPIPHWIKELFDIGYWGEWGISRAFMLGIVFFGLYLILGNFIPNLPLFTFNWLVATAPIWVPIGLIIGAWKAWVTYIQSLYISGRQPVLLEMKIPREVARSPRAMELALTSLNLSSGETTFLHRAWRGQVRPFFSFEIASFGGEIHFYIWCWKNYKDIIEGMLYAHYPEIELVEVEDYATKFQYDPEKHNVWGVEWPLMTYMGIGQTDFRINAYQPRTYVDFELDKDPKEEFKIDPLANVLEFMSSIKPNEQLWIQIVLRKLGKRYILNPFGKPDEDNLWKDMVENEVNKLRAEAAIIPAETLKEVLAEHGEEEDKHVSPRPSWKQNEMMKAMERHLGKYPFEVGMRGIYWVEGDLRGPIFTGFRWIWRPFGNPQYGTHLRPKKWHCDFDYPWQDFHDYRWINQGYRVHDAFRRRSFFNSPWILPTNVLTNETIASLWHPPSRAVAVPGIQRMAATKAEPPANLPK
ncbi:hypothetical protein A3C20_04540 [Candidatus Kaiserbacteria bacterium RIFCSPHIGHO2_02_FULL_55_25]|uniref:Uncharacterized protein n=1 Tax=Candidatus Kaiserbacteria bacterium RIFCSPHIGHO2_02_FULL_55_25 TaxID=1798498 RepID=A0A1F6EAY3_9BACT|nr:MAG: hypothetical protein A2764_03675 [Candidatus Kaiserbacteria bacterium RIFCSPHIGHO2_01_FULL_55_79]OGG70761.1 MAG: hypothetical protein A3C20_04540 [Candidatus Kaiserbacteria bacterium RIFCSPHIGHO2_02_FULL_55_25]OGG76916.1 MAG: hypothetical protein A3F56_04865 [Candidatus Kaiserbacteria bacterium RIFCSPHIGHO2_12_FULL_55_13]OGG83446.1 MAG: hypothetical protein A3A42_04525 [Candidatus Kaiserbacteria bacterium RIFCSPLOWO2_01_FULL_55_25]